MLVSCESHFTSKKPDDLGHVFQKRTPRNRFIYKGFPKEVLLGKTVRVWESRAWKGKEPSECAVSGTAPGSA